MSEEHVSLLDRKSSENTNRDAIIVAVVGAVALAMIPLAIKGIPVGVKKLTEIVKARKTENTESTE